MIEAPYKSEVITGYLLGSLSAAETEQLDELSITDATFADALRAAEADLVDAYVLGELGDDERRLFETRYLASAHGRDKVEFALSLVSYGERQVSIEKPGRLAVLKSYFAQGHALQWGFAAAAVVLLVAGSWLATQNLRLRQQVRATQAQADELRKREQQLQRELAAQQSAPRTGSELAQGVEKPGPEQTTNEPLAPRQPGSTSIFSLVITPQLRGIQRRPVITLKPETSLVSVKLVLEPNSFSSYRVVLLDEAGQSVWRSSIVRSQATNGVEALEVRFPASVLKSDAFALRVSGTAANGDEVLGDYGFTVVR